MQLTAWKGEEHREGWDPGPIWAYFFQPLLLNDSAVTTLQQWMMYQQLLLSSEVGGQLITECAVLLLSALDTSLELEV